jgi:hypothetical protein
MDAKNSTLKASMKKIIFPFCLLTGFFLNAYAHIGSPGVVMEGSAGPYHVLVMVAPPDVIPGTTTVTVYLQQESNVHVYARPIYYRTGSKGAPSPDLLQPVPGIVGQYRGVLWLMNNGSSSIELHIEGSKGKGSMIVPVVAISTVQKKMPVATVYWLAILGILLFILMLTIIGASVSDAITKKGEPLPAGKRRSRWIGVSVAALLCSLLLYGGNAWWQSEASMYRRFMYVPMQANSKIEQVGNHHELLFTIDTSGTRGSLLSYMIPDHGKIMHMFIMRIPGMDAFAHLHPKRVDTASYKAVLPSLPAGKYIAFADIVYNSGFTETIKDSFEIAHAITDSLNKTDPDDAYAFAIPDNVVDNPMLLDKNTIICGKTGSGVKLSDGSTLVWEGVKDEPVEAGQLYTFRFALYDKNKQPAQPEPYLGMQGHAAIVRNDGNVYVHLHPAGTISMAAEKNLQARIGDNISAAITDRKIFRDSVDRYIQNLQSMTETQRNVLLNAGMNMKMDSMPGMRVNNMIQFPYSFPSPGQYRIWVQCKRNGQILTAAFDKLVR